MTSGCRSLKERLRTWTPEFDEICNCFFRIHGIGLGGEFDPGDLVFVRVRTD